MTAHDLLVPLADGQMPTRLFVPEAGTGPGVLLVQEIFGASPYLVRRATELADLGYVVALPELFWRLGVSAVANGPDMLAEGIDLSSRFDWPTGLGDAAAALDWLRARPEVSGPVGLLGFCFGGGLAFNLAAVAEPDALVAYYGSALPRLLDLAPQVTAASLHHFGTADAYLDAAVVGAAVRAHGARVELHEGAGHAFDNDDFVAFDPEASAAAWGQTTRFLAEHLRG